MPERASSWCLDLLRDRYDALLVANGTPLSRGLLTRLRKRSDHVVALDGGVNTLFRCQIVPDLVVGDLDSALSRSLAWAKAHGAKIHRLPSQDAPDMAKGIEFCRALGMKRILIAGFSGERTDHLLSSLAFVSRLRGVDIELVTDDVVIFPLHGRVSREWCVPLQHTVSWFAFPLAGSCSLSGVQWPFRNRTLSVEGFHSLSNRPTDPQVRLSQRSGRSLFIIGLRPQPSA